MHPRKPFSPSSAAAAGLILRLGDPQLAPSTPMDAATSKMHDYTHPRQQVNFPSPSAWAPDPPTNDGRYPNTGWCHPLLSFLRRSFADFRARTPLQHSRRPPDACSTVPYLTLPTHACPRALALTSAPARASYHCKTSSPGSLKQARPDTVLSPLATHTVPHDQHVQLVRITTCPKDCETPHPAPCAEVTDPRPHTTAPQGASQAIRACRPFRQTVITMGFLYKKRALKYGVGRGAPSGPGATPIVPQPRQKTRTLRVVLSPHTTDKTLTVSRAGKSSTGNVVPQSCRTANCKEPPQPLP